MIFIFSLSGHRVVPNAAGHFYSVTKCCVCNSGGYQERTSYAEFSHTGFGEKLGFLIVYCRIKSTSACTEIYTDFPSFLYDL